MKPKLSYFVCFTARSGSTLLCEALANAGLAGRPEEYFNVTDLRLGARAAVHEPVWEEDKRSLDFPRYLDRVLDYGTTDNGVFGSKLSWEDLGEVRKGLQAMPEYRDLPLAAQLAAAFPNPRYIWVTRRDKVRQAISLARAIQTDVWMQKMDTKPAASEVRLNYGLIDWYLHELIHEEVFWSQFFEEASIVPHTVVYEDLTRGYEQIVRQVVGYLGVSLHPAFQFPPPRLQRQADDLTETWVRGYFASHAASQARRERIRRPARRVVRMLTAIGRRART